MRYLVTGGAGFIGSHIVEELVRRGARVRVLDNFSMGKMANLKSVCKDVELLRGSVEDERMAARAVKGVDVIFHEAALASVEASIQQPARTHQANATGTLTLLEAARRSGVKRVVLASSSSVYGNQGRRAASESMALNPLSPYAASKIAAETYARAYTNVYGLSTISLRYFNVYGPRQDPDSPYSAVIPLFIKAMTQGKRPVIYGDGGQSRDFTFVQDVVEANLKAAAIGASEPLILNCATSRGVTLLQLVAELNHLLGSRLVPVFKAARVGEIRQSCAFTNEIRRAMGFVAAVKLREGLEKTCAWFQNAFRTR